MKSFIKTILSVILVIVTNPALSSVNTDVKSIGGLFPECSNVSQWPINKLATRFHLNTIRKDGALYSAQMTVELVECINQSWTRRVSSVENLKTEEIGELKQKISGKTTYKDFMIIIKDKDQKELQKIKLPELQRNSQANFIVKFNTLDLQKDMFTNLKYADVSLVATQIVENNVEYESKQVDWGYYRINLNGLFQ